MRKNDRRKSAGKILMLTLLLFCFCSRADSQQKAAGDHTMLYWAGLLVDHIGAASTDYRHKETSVTWANESGATAYQSYTDCSGLINSLLKQTYGFGDAFLRSWLGKSRPLAYNYYDAIAREDRFRIVHKIGDILPGDLIVLKYADRSDHEDNTGHCMLVVKSPERRKATAVLEPGMDQYEVMVIDASRSPHGKTDTRYLPDGTEYSGSGKGIFRLYADGKGDIRGYSWSVQRPKPDFDPFANSVLVGRIDINLRDHE